MRILFVTWDGPQVSYLEALFLPIFAGLKRHGFECAVLQFTWGDPKKSERAAAKCAAAQVPYRRVSVPHRSPGHAFITAALGARDVDRAARDWRIDALMPRSLLPALSVLLSKSSRKLPIIFDADGLPADERVEFGKLSPRSPVYRVLRSIERSAVRRAASVLVRTQAAVPILAERAGRGVSSDKFYVVSNGRDPAPFATSLGTTTKPTAPRLCYLGSLGPQYLPVRMLELAMQIRARLPETTMSIFTCEREVAANALAACGLDQQSWITIESLEPTDVPNALTACDVGFALRQPSFSMQAVAPVKIGDYLLGGVPIIGTEGVGPTSEPMRSGCMLSAARPVEEIAEWVAFVLADRESFRERCRALGIAEFSVSRSVEQYSAALRPRN